MSPLLEQDEGSGQCLTTHRKVFDPRGPEGLVGSRGTKGRASSNRAAKELPRKQRLIKLEQDSVDNRAGRGAGPAAGGMKCYYRKGRRV